MAKHLTVGELRKRLEGLPDNMPVYTMDHDHSEWETNGLARYVEVKNQSKMDSYAKEMLNKDTIFKIKGDYLTISA